MNNLQLFCWFLFGPVAGVRTIEQKDQIFQLCLYLSNPLLVQASPLILQRASARGR